jgi:hypothetical protein
MAEPRIWFDPPAFSWGRVLRIGLLWSAAVLMVLVPVLLTVDKERPAHVVGPALVIVQEPAGALPAASQSPATAVAAARVASSPAAAASGPAIAR